MGEREDTDLDALFSRMTSARALQRKAPAPKGIKEVMFKPAPSNEREELYMCKTCHVPTLYDYEMNEVACPKCGVVDTPCYETSRSLSYEDERFRNFSSYSYKRSSHMSDWIARVQGKCTHSIPTRLVDAVRAELKKHREPLDTVTPEKIRWVLRKIKQGVYYDQSSYIAFIISGQRHMQIPEELETQLKVMFTAVEKEF